MARIVLLVLMALSWSTAAPTADFTGQASVIDGDTLEIYGRRIRLFGIDAPESRQTCEADH
jgi:endonuclease YncB( thermonuclease family)